MKINYARNMCLCAGFIALATLAACDKRSAEEKGTDMATEKIDMAKGIGNALESKGGQASEAVTTGLGTVFKGIEKGVDKSGRVIAADESLAKAGLKVTKVQDALADEQHKTHGLDLYVVADAEARGKLRVLAFDSLDREIGRANIDLASAADEAKYLRVPMEAQVVLSSVRKVAVSYKPGETVAKK